MIELKAPMQGASVPLQTEAQKAFLKDEAHRAELDGNLTFRWYDLERVGEDSSIPLAVSFAWEGSENESASYYLLISEREDMKDSEVYITKQTALEVYNLKSGVRYFWCVRQNGKSSKVLSFQTEGALPRFIRLDAISNVRDMGGYAVKGGKIRQGLLYRGGEFELHCHLSEEGGETLCRLGIRTELDMRGEAIGKVEFTSAEALGIRRVLIPSVPYSGIFKEENRQNVRRFFKTLTHKSYYPIYFHCWGGADRTGTFAFVIGAFLGMSLEDLINDYELTSLSVWGTRTRNYGLFQEFLASFRALSGESLQEKAETFLRDYAALTAEERARLYTVLVEETTD